MTVGDAPADLWIVGPGRLGLALGMAMIRRGWPGRLTFVGRHPVSIPFNELGMGEARYVTYPHVRDSAPPDLLVLTVPDGSIEGAATAIAALGLPPAVALHTSGALPSAALGPLAASGWKTASLHPLVAVPDPESGARKLVGAWYGIEGAADAVLGARSIVRQLDGRELVLDVGSKPVYHAAAVMASNHVVALLDVAISMITRCGVDHEDGAAALGALARGALDDISTRGTVQALTGPVVRGDAETVQRHLAQLSGDESRLYSVLAREALRIAAARGLSPDAVATIEAILLEESG